MNTVMVTGSSRGLGLEFCRQYAGEGWSVIAACRNPERADKLRDLATSNTDLITVLPLEVTDIESVGHAAVLLKDRSIDLLINCAGVLGTSGQTAGRLDYENWRWVLDVNTFGPMRVTEAFMTMLERGNGKLVVSITSGMGSLADNSSGGSIAYRTSKAALNMAMRSAAIDLAAKGITCVVINPGWVRTDMGGPRAPLAPEDSVQAMREVISKVRPSDSGKFLNYDGREFAW